MPKADDVHNSLAGAWRLMTGRADGFRLLDLSADGFWNSFFALVVALPPMLVGWTSYVNEIMPGPELFAERLGLMPRLAIIDFGAWILPLLALAAVARQTGLSGRFVHYVVASNWAGAIIAWMVMPPALVRLFFPAAASLTALLGLAIFVMSLIFVWQLTNAALNRGPVVATIVFFAMAVAELTVLLVLKTILGVGAQIPA